jgi:hydrogenase nickel incorporation protein HypB
MCNVCGCDDHAKPTGLNLQTGEAVAMTDEQRAGSEHGHAHAHPHVHVHEHVRPDGTRYVHAHSHEVEHVHADGTRHALHPASVIELEARVLAKNDALAGHNRAWLAERGILALNLMSAPGAGKTTLLERTIRETATRRPLFVLEGDQATANDGERIRAAGAPVVQINTGTGCHLDADMVARALADLNPAAGSIVVIENVGNLVCPALFDIGERYRIVVLSVTEGDDKPLKYPHMFRAADLVLLNKIDLLPYVDFDVARATANARAVNPEVTLISVSARTGQGMRDWYDWLARDGSRGAIPSQATA